MIKQINCESAATGLHDYLVKTHWNGLALKGPDPGIRFNARFGRFVKSSLSFLPWSDNIAYAQAQKYWIASNWLMADLGLADKSRCQEMAVACSEYLLTAQRPEGYWGSDPRPLHSTKGQLMVLRWLGYRGNGGVESALNYRLDGCIQGDGGFAYEIKDRTVYLPCDGAGPGNGETG